MHYFWLLTLSSTIFFKFLDALWDSQFEFKVTIKNCSAPDCGAVAGNINTQPKQGRQAGPMSSLYSLMSMEIFLLKELLKS